MIAIENMSIDKKAEHILHVLNFAQRYTDEEWMEQVLVDAAYVVDQLQIEILKLREESK
jgi:hypothetical protein